jgi:hypothetical protein
MAGFQGQRLMGFAPGSYNADTRTVEAVLSTGSQVKRYFFTEELEISGDAVDLARAVSGLVPLLDSTTSMKPTPSRHRVERPHRRRPAGRHADLRPDRPRQAKSKAWSPAAS